MARSRLTDLDVKRENSEISTLITDGQLNVKAEGPSLVIHQPEEVLSSMVMWNQNNFTQSGLMEEIRSSTVSHQKAYDETLKFIKKHCSFQTAMLAGSSVYIDREFLGEQMPEIYNYLHPHCGSKHPQKSSVGAGIPKSQFIPKTSSIGQKTIS
jgi:oligoribonuclease